MNLFFDTETTGKADFRAGPEAPHQPRIVQLAALMAADDGAELAALHCIIHPDGFDIPPEASAIHGITMEKAERCGVGVRFALGVFLEMWECSTTVVAHNIDFDLLMLNVEFCHDAGRERDWGSPRDLFCTMKAMTPICKLPGVYGRDYKWPKLQEAHKHAFGEEFAGAHDAMADVRACAKVYFWLRQREASFASAVSVVPLPLADSSTPQPS